MRQKKTLTRFSDCLTYNFKFAFIKDERTFTKTKTDIAFRFCGSA